VVLQKARGGRRVHRAQELLPGQLGRRKGRRGGGTRRRRTPDFNVPASAWAREGEVIPVMAASARSSSQQCFAGKGVGVGVCVCARVVACGGGGRSGGYSCTPCLM